MSVPHFPAVRLWARWNAQGHHCIGRPVSLPLLARLTYASRMEHQGAHHPAITALFWDLVAS